MLDLGYRWIPPARAAQLDRDAQDELDARHAAATKEVEAHSDFLGTIWDVLPVGSDPTDVERAEKIAAALRVALAPFRGDA